MASISLLYQGKYSYSELIWHRYSSVEISSTVNEPIQWDGIGMSSLFGLNLQLTPA